MITKKTPNNKVVIYGSKSFAQLLKNILEEDLDIKPLCFIDDFSTSNKLSSIPIVSLANAVKQYGNEIEILLGVGYSNLSERLKLIEKLRTLNLKLFTLIHPTAYISKSARINCGAIIMQNSCVSQGASIGEATVLWPMSNISHDCKINENCFLSPGSTICGFSEVGHSSFIGANATIVDNVNVPPFTFIKAGGLYHKKISSI